MMVKYMGIKKKLSASHLMNFVSMG